MYAAELEKVRKKLRKIFKKNFLQGKKIYLFGVSDNTRQVIGILRENGYEPIGVIDNDKNKIGSYCAGLKVHATTDITVSEDIICLIYSFYHQEMKRQLQALGWTERQVSSLMPKDLSIPEIIVDTMRGKIIHDQLIRKYGDITIFLCPYTGTGDIYLIGTFWDEYIKNEGIEDYIFVVISGACKKVAQIFDIKNIVCLKNQKDGEWLIRYYSLCPDKVRLKLLNDAWAQINDNLTEWFRGYKGWYFTELFRKFVFDLPDTSRPRHPVFRDESSQLEILFRENGLVENKTVILSPYSNTLADLPDEFWIKITKFLLDKGYKVCTNSSGEQEPAIAGSIPIFFPLNIAPQFMDKAGIFIGVRSGLCDVISGSKAKKIILYDAENRFYNSSAYEYFSLIRMGLCDDAIEIEYSHDNLEEAISKVISII